MNWTTAMLYFGFFSGLGIIIDRFMLVRVKGRLHLSLTNMWDRIDDWEIPDFPKQLASFTLKYISHWASRYSALWKKVLFIVFLSWILTSVAGLLGLWLEDELTLQKSPIPLPYFTIYLVNLPFDMVTVFIALHILKIVHNSNAVAGFVAIVIYVPISLMIASYCWIAINYSQELAMNLALPGTSFAKERDESGYRPLLQKQLERDGFSDQVELKINRNVKTSDYPLLAFRLMIDVPRYGRVEGIVTEATIIASEKEKRATYNVTTHSYASWAPFLLAATTMIPTFVYISALLLLLIAKVVLDFTRLIVLYVLELFTQADPIREPKEFMPFTLLGLLFGVIGSLIKLLTSLTISAGTTVTGS